MSNLDPSREPVKGHCPKCGPSRLSDVVGHHHVSGSDEIVWVETDYRILKCRACEAVFCQIETACSEDYDYEVDQVTGELQMVAKRLIPLSQVARYVV
jgi:hypothetical protein